MRDLSRLAMIVAVSACAGLWGQALRVAVFRTEVTPPIGSPLCCSAGVKPAARINDPLTARGVILTGRGKPIVLAVVDWEGIANEGWDEWRQAMAAAARTDAAFVSVHTVHQHDAPAYDPSAERILAAAGIGAKLYDPPFMKQALEHVTAAVRAAAGGAQEVTHIGLGRAAVKEVASNRRILGADGKVQYVRFSASRIPEARQAPEGLIDPSVRLISFWNGDRPLAALTYYATHPQSYYGQGAVSADFVGMARSMREAEWKIPVVHFNGAGGNVAAGKYNDGSPGMRPVLAGRLSEGMKAAWDSMTKTPIQAKDAAWKSVAVTLPVAAAYRDQGALQKLVSSGEEPIRARLTAARDLAFSRLVSNGRRTPVFLLTLGPAQVVHMPGELFVEYQLAAQARQAGQFVAMAAYGDYGPGYIGTEAAYGQGGYETGPVSRTAPSVEGVLMDAINKLLPQK